MAIETHLHQMAAAGPPERGADDVCVVELLFDTPRGRTEVEAAVARAVHGQTVQVEAALEDTETGSDDVWHVFFPELRLKGHETAGFALARELARETGALEGALAGPENLYGGLAVAEDKSVLSDVCKTKEVCHGQTWHHHRIRLSDAVGGGPPRRALMNRIILVTAAALVSTASPAAAEVRYLRCDYEAGAPVSTNPEYYRMTVENDQLVGWETWDPGHGRWRQQNCGSPRASCTVSRDRYERILFGSYPDGSASGGRYYEPQWITSINRSTGAFSVQPSGRANPSGGYQGRCDPSESPEAEPRM